MMGFTNWFPLTRVAIGDLPRFGDVPAVYAFREIGSSELLYIGSTGCLRQRLFGNYLGGVGGLTTQRINGLLCDEQWLARVEVAWERTDAYKAREEDLKEHYRRAFNRLPSWTRR
jgi:hypothetical protein